jgi:hypothetical protein
MLLNVLEFIMDIPVPILSLIVAIGAFLVSITVAYLTLFRRGVVKMTQPTTIYFGADSGNRDGNSLAPKVFLRTLLYSTSKRGNVINSLHVRLTRGESIQTFNVWVYGEDKLMRGSGLYVGEQGVVVNHHFLPPSDGTSFKFLSGLYKIEVFATKVGHLESQLLWSTSLDLSQNLVDQMDGLLAGGIHFDWQPNSGVYHAHSR